MDTNITLADLLARIVALETTVASLTAPKAAKAKPATAPKAAGAWTLTIPDSYTGKGIYGNFFAALKATGKTTFNRDEALAIAAPIAAGTSKTASVLCGDFRLVVSRLPAPVAQAPVITLPVDETPAVKNEAPAPVLDITPAPVADAPKAKRTAKAKANAGK